QSSKPPVPAIASDELATIKLRYKEPAGDKSRLLEHVVAGQPRADAAVSGDFQFASAVAAFGMLLRGSAYRGEATYDMVLELAQPGLAHDANGYRSEFVRLVREARELKRP
ncbi:MAG TPA: YfbK domain-containing protein, partial [Pirellulales bacterium]|nr:YfbK domain-containing protein [Pirellulales bacterium]